MSESDSRFEVIVAGGGPVGVALALLNYARGISTIVIARESSDSAVTTMRASATRVPYRPIALSHASAGLLEELRLLDIGRATPITRVHVSQRGTFGRTVMDAKDQGLPALGYVVEAGELARAAPHRRGNLVMRGQVGGWTPEADGIEVEWSGEDGSARRSRARLLVLADGGEASAQIERDYGQQAIVCAVRSSVPHAGVAYERFTPEGPLALLPHQDHYAVVWSVRTVRAEQLLQAGEDAFLESLERNFGTRRGRLSAPGTRLAYPLALRRSISMQARVISIGNAAQTLHPVAGQGLNLGLRDAVTLADELAASPADGIGSAQFVKQYYQRRLTDRVATIALTDLLARAFTVGYAPAGLLRGAALTALDVLPPARNFFARRMVLGARGMP